MDFFWKEKRVLVTGATGLVGSSLTKSLIEKGAHVVVLIRDYDPQSELIKSGYWLKTTVVNGSLEDGISCERAINEYEIDTVFHLGALTIVGAAYRAPLQTFESNIRGTYMLLEACRRHQNMVKRVVIASSDKAYGSNDLLPYTEETPLRGLYPYDVSKSCTDLISNCYFQTYNLPIGIARCGNIYGPGDLNWSRLIPGTIKALLEEKAIEIRSDGSATRDYLYIEDIVEAYLCLAKSLSRKEILGEAFNFGLNKPYTVLDVVHMLRSLMKKNHVEIKILNQSKAEIKHQTLNSEKAKNLLQWEPEYSMEQGLKSTLEWYTNLLAPLCLESC